MHILRRNLRKIFLNQSLTQCFAAGAASSGMWFGDLWTTSSFLRYVKSFAWSRGGAVGKDWKDVERLVRALEQSVSPDAKVEHNVFLPQVGSTTGAKSQCDIVIREGSSARPFLTIVEVQSRKSKVDINEFLGWLGKRDLVGAQRLICVSRRGFSSTIKELAAKEGGGVALIQLRELEPEALPLDFISFHLQYRHFELRSILKLSVGVSREHLEELGIRDRFFKNASRESNSAEKIWSLDRNGLISLEEVLKGALAGEGDFPDVTKLSISIGVEDPIYTFFEGQFVRASIDIEFECVNRLYSVPMSTLVYEQLGHGALGWVMEGFLKTDYGDVKAKIPITRTDKGAFKMRDEDVVMEGPAGNMEIYEAGPRSR